MSFLPQRQALPKSGKKPEHSMRNIVLHESKASNAHIMQNIFLKQNWKNYFMSKNVSYKR